MMRTRAITRGLFREAGGLRDFDALFDFLMEGYRLITLTSVSDVRRDALCTIKSQLGVLVTLIDDLADNPSLNDDAVLIEARHIPFDLHRIRVDTLDHDQHRRLSAFVELGRMIVDGLRDLPHFDHMKPLLALDLRRIHATAEYALALKRLPAARSYEELLSTQHITMTVCPVGVMDLMASPRFVQTELGDMRAAFLRAQRAARLSNVLTTYARERAEGDITNELAARVDAGEDIADAQRVLDNQRRDHIAHVERLADRITTFDVRAYANALHAVDDLHLRFEDARTSAEATMHGENDHASTAGACG